MTQDQLNQYAEQQSCQAELSDQMCENSYRSGVAADAFFAKHELLTRLGGDGSLTPREHLMGLPLEGAFAGPHPVDDAADYLEILANKLKQQKRH